MKLPCVAFELPRLSPTQTDSGLNYRTERPVFGTVDIKTRQDLSRLDSLCFVHPWLDALLGREDVQSGVAVEDDTVHPSSLSVDDEDESNEVGVDARLCPGPNSSHPRPALIETAPMGKEMRALRLVARLRQPFGALLFTLASTHRRAVEYRRVAADNVITVQIQENVSLTDVLDNVQILDVL